MIDRKEKKGKKNSYLLLFGKANFCAFFFNDQNIHIIKFILITLNHMK